MLPQTPGSINTLSNEFRRPQPSDAEIIGAIRGNLDKGRMPSTGDIKFLLDVCTRESKLRQSVQSNSRRLLESAVRTIAIAMEKHPRIAVPIVIRSVRQSLENKSRQSPLAPQLAEVVWDYQRRRFDVDGTGWACLRHLAARCLPNTGHNLFSILTFCDVVRSDIRECQCAVLSLMRLACDKSGFLGFQHSFAAKFLITAREDYPTIIDDCAYIFLREIGEKNVDKDTAWKILQKQLLAVSGPIETNTDLNAPPKEEGVSSDGVDTDNSESECKSNDTESSDDDDYLMENDAPIVLSKPYLNAIVQRDFKTLEILIDHCLSSYNYERDPHIRSICTHFRYFKSVIPSLTDYFVQQCKFQLPHIALLAMFYAENGNHEQLIEIAGTRVVPRQLRQQGVGTDPSQDAGWRKLCKRMLTLKCPIDANHLWAGWQAALPNVHLADCREGGTPAQIARRITEFSRSTDRYGLIAIPVFEQGMAHFILAKDKNFKVSCTFLNTMVNTRDKTQRERFRQFLDLITQSKPSCGGKVPRIRYIETLLPVMLLFSAEETEQLVPQFNNDPYLLDWTLRKKHSRVLGLELKDFLRRKTIEASVNYQHSNPIVKDFLTEYGQLTDWQCIESYRDRRIEAAVNWMLQIKLE